MSEKSSGEREKARGELPQTLVKRVHFSLSDTGHGCTARQENTGLSKKAQEKTRDILRKLMERKKMIRIKNE